jgi:transposase-like protein
VTDLDPLLGGLEKRNVREEKQEDSMGTSQPTYSKEFKQEAVRLFETSGKRKTQIARDLGIDSQRLKHMVQRIW